MIQPKLATTKGDTEEQSAKSSDTQDEETRWNNALEKTIEDLPRMELQLCLDENEANAVFDLARKFNFQHFEISNIKSKQVGGGRPNERFVDYLVYSDIKIEELEEACDNLEMKKIVLLLIDIKGKKEYCKELTPAEAAQLHPHLVEEAKSNTVKCWKDLAHELGLSYIISNMEGAIAHGNKYSAAEGLFDNLNMRSIKIRDFGTKLQEIEDDPNLVSVQKVIKIFNTAVKNLVKLEKQKEEKTRKRKEERLNARKRTNDTR